VARFNGQSLRSLALGHRHLSKEEATALVAAVEKQKSSKSKKTCGDDKDDEETE
jgi:hypothetical protein